MLARIHNKNANLKQPLKGNQNAWPKSTIYGLDGDRINSYFTKYGGLHDGHVSNNINNNEHYDFDSTDDDDDDVVFDDDNNNDDDVDGGVDNKYNDLDDINNEMMMNTNRNFFKPTVFYDPVFNPLDDNSNDELILFDY